MSNPEPKRPSLSVWFVQQYVDGVGLGNVEGGAKFKQLAAALPVRSTLVKSVPYPSSGHLRMNKFLRLKLRWPMGRKGYQCAVMRARIRNCEIVYALAYWRNGAPPGGDPEYVCIAPTFDSRDGEYRRRFIPYHTYEKTYLSITKEMSQFEDAVMKMVGEGTLAVAVSTFPPSRDNVDNLEKSRLPVTALSVMLLVDLFRTESDRLAANAIPSYGEALQIVADRFPELVKYSKELQTTPDRNTVTVAIINFQRASGDRLSVMCGQKLVPLTVRETVQQGDLTLAAWRELEITRAVSDLVLNFVSPNFAYFNQWTYIDKADRTLYENPGIRARYRRSAAATEASKSIREARGRLAELDADRDYRTEEVGLQLHDSIFYAQSFLLLSPMAILYTMEDVGRALHSVDTFYRYQPTTPWPVWADVFYDIDDFAHLVFDYVYGVYCLHTRLSVAHTDLHGGNLTYNPWGDADLAKTGANGERVYSSFYEDPVVLYVTGPKGEADTYVFPCVGTNGCIIDYSRCVLGPAYRARMADDRADRVYADQADRVVRALRQGIGSEIVTGHEEALKALAATDFDAVFSVLCAADYAMLGTTILGTLNEARATSSPKDPRPCRVSDEAIDFAIGYQRMSSDLYITRLQDLVEIAEGAAKKRDAKLEDPGAHLIRTVFDEWRFPRWARTYPDRAKTAQVVDAYNYNNPLRYSGDDYTKWPPWTRLDEIEKHLGPHKMTDLFERGVDLFLSALGPNTGVEEIAAELAAKEKI